MLVAPFNDSPQKILLKLDAQGKPTDITHAFCSVECLNQQSKKLNGAYRLMRKMESVPAERCDVCDALPMQKAG